MEIVTIGKVVVPARIENLSDLLQVHDNLLPQDKVGSVEVADALGDMGATMLSLPTPLIQQLGLRRLQTRLPKLLVGAFSFGVYEPAPDCATARVRHRSRRNCRR